VDTSSRVDKFFNEKYKLRRKLNRMELDCFLLTVSRQLEVVFKTHFTERIVENVLCKAFRALSKQDAKKGPSWCDALLPGQLLYRFESNSISLISPSGEIEQMEEKAIVTRFPDGDQVLTMDEVVSELELPSTMPSESMLWKSVVSKGEILIGFQGSAGCSTIREGRGDDNDYLIQLAWFSSNSLQAKANGGLKIYR
jgi:hypothetical protein